MAILKASNLFDIPHSGHYGNDSVAYSKFPSGTVANGTDTVDFMTVPAGARLYDWQMLSNAATGGTSPTMSLGWRYADGSAGGGAAVLLAATAITAASRTRAAAASTVVDVDKDIIIYGTSGGSGSSTAVVLEVIANYIARGTK